MNILVTGAAGYVGSHLIKYLLKKSKNKIYALDNFSNSGLSVIKKLKEINKEKLLFKKIDIKEKKKISTFILENKIDTIIHLAAKIDAFESHHFKKEYELNNLVASINLIKIASKHKIKKFIFASSAAIYGDVTNCFCSESQIAKPINPYGKFKYLAEKFITRKKNLNYTILRFFNIAGIDKDFYPYFYKRRSLFFSIIKHFYKKKNFFLANKSSKKNFQETPVRDYIHINDICRIIYMSLIKKKSSIINCGTGQKTSVKDFITRYAKRYKININIKYMKPRIGDPKCVVSNTSIFKNSFKKFKFTGFNVILNDCNRMYLYYKNNYR